VASENRIFNVCISGVKCLEGPPITLQFSNTNPPSSSKDAKIITDPAPLRTDVVMAHDVCAHASHSTLTKKFHMQSGYHYFVHVISYTQDRCTSLHGLNEKLLAKFYSPVHLYKVSTFLFDVIMEILSKFRKLGFRWTQTS